MKIKNPNSKDKFKRDFQKWKFKLNFEIETKIEFKIEFRNQVFKINIEIKFWNLNSKEKSVLAI